jgi:uncharacterized protein YndB with AHSA1/START domain
MSAKNESNEIKITRIYEAPVKLVWDAWTDPKQVAKWWGPRGFTITTHSKDLRVGGHWAYTMHGPDGTNYENKTIYFEVEKHSRLVYDHGGNDDRPPLFRVTVTFAETKGKTKMDMTMTLSSPEAAKEIRKHIKQAGGNSTWDRLAEYLDNEIFGKDSFVINRTFDAPIATVYKMWTDPTSLTKWLPPSGFKMEFIRAEIKKGGSAFYSMTNGETTMYARSNYIEMNAPHFISYTQQFCDKDEHLSHHPMAPTWPETMFVTITLSEEGADQTRVTVTTEVHGNATPEERAMFHGAKGGMTMGWTGSFDKLEEILAN